MVPLGMMCLFYREAEGDGANKELDIKTEFSSSPVECITPLPPPLEDNPYTISISVPAQD